MESCDCPHDANEHAPVADFGLSMCLVHDCDCEGTRAQVAAAKIERRSRMSSTAEKVYRTVLAVLSNPMQRTADDQARNIAAAIVAQFELTER